MLQKEPFCAKENNIKTIVRITADCPIIDPKIIDLTSIKLHFFKKIMIIRHIKVYFSRWFRCRTGKFKRFD